jgi:hypothetical protein
VAGECPHERSNHTPIPNGFEQSQKKLNNKYMKQTESKKEWKKPELKALSLACECTAYSGVEQDS